MIRNYDFLLLQLNDLKLVTGRRIVAAVIDIVVFVLATAYTISEAHPTFGEGGLGLSGEINGFLVLAIFYLPEVLFRQTLGMWLMDIVVLVPPNKNPYLVLFFRKMINFIECVFLPLAPIHFGLVMFSQKHLSFSDQITSCVIVRRPTPSQ